MKKIFIVESGELKIGVVAAIEDLATDINNVESAGFYQPDDENNKLYLYSSITGIAQTNPAQLGLVTIGSSLSSYSGYKLMYSPMTHHFLTEELQESGQQTASEVRTL